MDDATEREDGIGRLEVWCAGKEWCPVTTTATLIGKKWHPVIVHRLLENGPSGFNELKEHVDGISSKVLSDSLGGTWRRTDSWTARSSARSRSASSTR